MQVIKVPKIIITTVGELAPGQAFGDCDNRPMVRTAIDRRYLLPEYWSQCPAIDEDHRLWLYPADELAVVAKEPKVDLVPLCTVHDSVTVQVREQDDAELNERAETLRRIMDQGPPLKTMGIMDLIKTDIEMGAKWEDIASEWELGPDLHFHRTSTYTSAGRDLDDQLGQQVEIAQGPDKGRSGRLVGVCKSTDPWTAAIQLDSPQDGPRGPQVVQAPVITVKAPQPQLLAMVTSRGPDLARHIGRRVEITKLWSPRQMFAEVRGLVEISPEEQDQHEAMDLFQVASGSDLKALVGQVVRVYEIATEYACTGDEQAVGRRGLLGKGGASLGYVTLDRRLDNGDRGVVVKSVLTRPGRPEAKDKPEPRDPVVSGDQLAELVGQRVKVLRQLHGSLAKGRVAVATKGSGTSHYTGESWIQVDMGQELSDGSSACLATHVVPLISGPGLRELAKGQRVEITQVWSAADRQAVGCAGRVDSKAFAPGDSIVVRFGPLHNGWIYARAREVCPL